jgi:nicotinamidase-related amidase
VEAHVCVLQTVLGLLGEGWRVFVVDEGTGSRRARDRILGLDRMRQCGAQIVTGEMVVFEWLHRAGTERFRAISKGYLR